MGALVGLVVVARWGLARIGSDSPPSVGKTWLAITVTVAILMLLYIVPPLGILVATFMLLVGLGSLTREGYSRVRAPTMS